MFNDSAIRNWLEVQESPERFSIVANWGADFVRIVVMSVGDNPFGDDESLHNMTIWVWVDENGTYCIAHEDDVNWDDVGGTDQFIEGTFPTVWGAITYMVGLLHDYTSFLA